MISRIARLRAKKGFTIIELVVVMAIIGVLTSVVVATLSYDNKPTIGKGMAKDAFYVIQDALASSEVAYPLAMSDVADTTGYLGFFAETDNRGEVTAMGTVNITSTAGSAPTVSSPAYFPASISVTHAHTKADDINGMQSAVKNAFEKYLTTKDNMSGTLFVVADNKFRVVKAYWTDWQLLTPNSYLLAEDNILQNGYYCCGYPQETTYSGKYMFAD